MYTHAFDTDVMDDLAYDAAEGPSQGRQAYDGYDEELGDDFDIYDEADSADDEFIGGFIRQQTGHAPSVAADEFEEGEEGYEEADEFDAVDAYDEYDSYDELDMMNVYDTDGFDSFEDAVADAMDAEDSEEFIRRLSGIARRAIRIGRSVGRGIGRVARTVAPIVSAIPLPQAQIIGRIAGRLGKVLADSADDYEALDAMIDMVDDADLFDAAVPLLAGLALRTSAPRITRAPLPVRRQAVHAVTRAMQTLAQRQGVPATRAAVRVVRAIGQRPIPTRAIAPTLRRITPQIMRRPAQLRQLSRPLVAGARRGLRRSLGLGRRLSLPGVGGWERAATRRLSPGAGLRRRRIGGGIDCRHCGRGRRLRLRVAY